MKLIDISTKTFPKTFAMVDDADFDWLSKWKWRMNRIGYACGSFRQIDGKHHMIRMHREIMRTPPGMDTDHINGNKLDNRRENLRICTHLENTRNRPQRKGCGLPKGVRQYPHRGRFDAKITVNGRTVYLGEFRTVTEAANAYNEAAKKYFGEFAWLNKIEESANVN